MSTTQQTRCPHCHCVFKVYKEQLDLAEGQVRCGACFNVFDAIDNFIEATPSPQTFEAPTQEAIETAIEDIEDIDEQTIEKPSVEPSLQSEQPEETSATDIDASIEAAFKALEEDVDSFLEQAAAEKPKVSETQRNQSLLTQISEEFALLDEELQSFENKLESIQTPIPSDETPNAQPLSFTLKETQVKDSTATKPKITHDIFDDKSEQLAFNQSQHTTLPSQPAPSLEETQTETTKAKTRPTKTPKKRFTSSLKRENSVSKTPTKPKVPSTQPSRLDELLNTPPQTGIAALSDDIDYEGFDSALIPRKDKTPVRDSSASEPVTQDPFNDDDIEDLEAYTQSLREELSLDHSSPKSEQPDSTLDDIDDPLVDEDIEDLEAYTQSLRQELSLSDHAEPAETVTQQESQAPTENTDESSIFEIDDTLTDDLDSFTQTLLEELESEKSFEESSQDQAAFASTQDTVTPASPTATTPKEDPQTLEDLGAIHPDIDDFLIDDDMVIDEAPPKGNDAELLTASLDDSSGNDHQEFTDEAFVNDLEDFTAQLAVELEKEPKPAVEPLNAPISTPPSHSTQKESLLSNSKALAKDRNTPTPTSEVQPAPTSASALSTPPNAIPAPTQTKEEQQSPAPVLEAPKPKPQESANTSHAPTLAQADQPQQKAQSATSKQAALVKKNDEILSSTPSADEATTPPVKSKPTGKITVINGETARARQQENAASVSRFAHSATQLLKSASNRAKQSVSSTARHRLTSYETRLEEKLGSRLTSLQPAVQRRSSSLKKIAWLMGSLVLIFALYSQVLWVKRESVAQNMSLRPQLVFICSLVGCQVPPRFDLSKIQLRNSAVLPNAAKPDTLDVRLLMANIAKFEQPFPNIKLTFTNQLGVTIAARVFTPDEYKLSLKNLTNIPANTEVNIRFSIRQPNQKVTGYQFEFQ
ncbi:MAG: DUF3426 domain-containing protein [Pseudomonadota bacterium]